MVIKNTFAINRLHRTMRAISRSQFKSAISLVLLLLALLSVSTSAMATKIDVDVDRNPVEADESFAVTFTANDSVDGRPDFRPIEQFFKIMNRNQSSSIQINNGRMSRQTQWTLTLMPLRTGDLWIPSISFGDDKSPRVAVRVTASTHQSPGKGNDVLYLETEVDNKTAYVQSQIIYTVRVYQAINLLNAGLSELTLSDSDAVVEKLGDDKTYDKRINGRRYKVFEKRYAIYPQKSETLTIKPTQLQAQYVDSRRALRTKLLQSDPIKIEVKPIPALPVLQNHAWLPAKHMQIKEQWPQDPPVFKVGEPVTRTITVVADGLSSSQLPQFKMGEVPDMKQYLDQPVTNDEKSTNGIVGTREEKIALIPTKAGNYVIPAVSIPWWNTEKNSLEFLQLPKREITVLPGAQTAQQFGPGGSQNGQATQGLTSNQQPVTNPNPVPGATAIQTGNTSVYSFWMWVSLVAFLGWGLTALAWWRAGRTVAVKTATTQPVKEQLDNISRKQAIQQVKIACTEQNAQKAKNALLLWGKSVWPKQSPGNLNDLSRCSGGELAEQLLKLNKFLYSKDTAPWNADLLWQVFNDFQSKPQPPTHGSEDGLRPLYKTITG